MAKEIILELAKSIPTEWGIILLGAVPVTELRAAIPVAIALGVEPWKAFYLSWLGNFLPVLPLLYLLGPVITVLKRIPFFKKIIEAILKRTRKKSTKIERYGAVGLALFVGIPAPGTGVWTGSLLAYLFGIRPLYAVPAMMVGISIAGLLITLATLGVLELANFFSTKVAGIILLALIIVIILKKKTHTRSKRS